MKKNEIKSEVLLLLAAAIWGFGFVAQRAGMEFIGPFVFNGIRFTIAALVIFPLIFIFMKKDKIIPEMKKTIAPSIMSGFLLFIASTLQQIAIKTATAGKAAFITGLYVIFVPIIGMFVGHKTRKKLWIGAILALIGLYFLTNLNNTALQSSDIMLFLCAIFWAFHVLYIGKISKTHHPILIASLQFLFTGILSLIIAVFLESFNLHLINSAMIPILYAGVMSVGVAFTLQIFGQKKAHPAHAGIILSLEALFGFIGGILLLNEIPNLYTIIGAISMLLGIIIVQI